MPRRFPGHIIRDPIRPPFTICVLTFIAAVFAIASLCAAGFEVGIEWLASSQPGSTLQPADLCSPSRELEGGALKNRIRKLELSDPPGPKNHHAVQPNFTFQQKLIQAPAEGVIDDQFGVAVAVSGNTAVVGAYNANVGANLDQGAVYVFTENGGVWSQQQKLIASDGAAGDGFGVSVAIHGDTLVIGAYADDAGSESDQMDRGAAYIFNRSGNGWNQQQKLTGLDSVGGDLFGFAVAVNADAALIGSPMNDEVALDGGGAYVFTRIGSTWTQQQKLLANDTAEADAFGISVAIEENTAAMGALRHDVSSNNNQGAAYVFTRSGFSWSQQQKLATNDGTPNDQFGVSVGISGDSIIVGANFKDNATNLGQGAAYIFSKSTGAWTQQQKLLAADGTVEDGFGTSVAISGDTAVVGSSDNDLAAANQGSVYTFSRSGGIWTEEQKIGRAHV